MSAICERRRDESPRFEQRQGAVEVAGEVVAASSEASVDDGNTELSSLEARRKRSAEANAAQSAVCAVSCSTVIKITAWEAARREHTGGQDDTGACRKKLCEEGDAIHALI